MVLSDPDPLRWNTFMRNKRAKERAEREANDTALADR
jgi:hypothetical protein